MEYYSKCYKCLAKLVRDDTYVMVEEDGSQGNCYCFNCLPRTKLAMALVDFQGKDWYPAYR